MNRVTDDFNRWLYLRGFWLLGFICWVICAAVLFGFLAGCQGKQIKPISEMTPQERGLFFMQVYNDQFEDYQTVAKRENLTQEQKNILAEKKKILTKIYPMIKMYISYTESGAVPDPETEKQIIDIIDELLLIQLE